METKKKNNNRVWIIITIVISIICILSCIATAIFVLVTNNIKDTNELKALNDQVNRIADIGYQNNKVNLDGIENEMKSTITTGKRKVVEEALEEYTMDLYKEVDTTINSLTDQKITSLLSPDNISKDGKEFKVSKEYITTKKKEINDNKDNLNKLLKEDNIMQYIEKKKTSSKYEEMFKLLAIGSNGIPESDIQQLNKLIDKNIRVLEISEEAINLLSSNQDKWNLVNNQVVFTDQATLDKYNEIIKQEI